MNVLMPTRCAGALPARGRGLRRWLTALCLTALGAGAAVAADAPPDCPTRAAKPVPTCQITITDVVGRTVGVTLPVQRVILEESRQLYTVALLEPGDPSARIVGWGGDLAQADPDTYREYAQRFARIQQIPDLGRFSSGSFNIEQAIALKPDVIVLNMEADRLAQDQTQVALLEAMGIAVVYVDFRHQPQRNSERSIEIFGQLLQRQARAEAFIAFRRAELARVSEVLARAQPSRPKVFIERIAGLTPDCCFSFGAENMGRYVELAGGINTAKDLIFGTFGQISAEQVMASNPAQIILSSGDWHAINPEGSWVPVGPGADAQRVQAALQGFVNKPAYRGTDAVKQGQIHAVWHQFYNSPYDFVVVQQLARWFHPSLFAEVDAQATFKKLHDEFLPVDYQAGYFASLNGAAP